MNIYKNFIILLIKYYNLFISALFHSFTYRRRLKSKVMIPQPQITWLSLPDILYLVAYPDHNLNSLHYEIGCGQSVSDPSIDKQATAYSFFFAAHQKMVSPGTRDQANSLS